MLPDWLYCKLCSRHVKSAGWRPGRAQAARSQLADELHLPPKVTVPREKELTVSRQGLYFGAVSLQACGEEPRDGGDPDYDQGAGDIGGTDDAGMPRDFRFQALPADRLGHQLCRLVSGIAQPLGRVGGGIGDHT